MEPFAILGMIVLLTTKCLELLSGLRLYIIHSALVSNSKILRYVFVVPSTEPKNFESFRESLRPQMVSWLHAENDSKDQLQMAITNVNTSGKNVDKVIQCIIKQKAISKMYVSTLLTMCQNSIYIPKTQIWSQKILTAIISCLVSFVMCEIMLFRGFNYVGFYWLVDHPHFDMLATGAFVTIVSYMGHSGIRLLANAKDKVRARRGTQV